MLSNEVEAFVSGPNARPSRSSSLSLIQSDALQPQTTEIAFKRSWIIMAANIERPHRFKRTGLLRAVAQSCGALPDLSICLDRSGIIAEPGEKHSHLPENFKSPRIFVSNQSKIVAQLTQTDGQLRAGQDFSTHTSFVSL